MNKQGEKGSASKILDIFEVFSHESQYKKISQIANELNLTYPTAHRLVSLLVDRGYLYRNANDKRVSLGARIHFLGKVASTSLNLINLAVPVMKKVSEESGETVNLFVRDGDYRVCYESIESKYGLKHSAPIGIKLPLWAGASGKCFLAFDKDIELEEIFKQAVPLTQNTISDPEFFLEEIKQIRAKGLSLSNSEREEGVSSMAAPIFNRNSKMVAAITISGPEFRLKKLMEEKYFSLLRSAADNISTELGYSMDNIKPGK
jgi:DNA-binding IclR family transcriptional regulator